MSNQIGLMLSFIFLLGLIVFSGEVICYQTMYAQAINKTEEIAIYIEEYGNTNVSKILAKENYFDDYKIVKSPGSDGFTTYKIKTVKDYDPFSNICKYLSNEIIVEMTVVRKE